MSRIAAAIAFACTIVLVSDPSHARARLRLFSSTPKAGLAAPLKPIAAAPAPARSSNTGLYIAVGSRPAAATSDAPAQSAVDDPAKGPLQFDPTFASPDPNPPVAAADDKTPVAPKALAAAPSTECTVAKEPAPAKEKETVAAEEPAKAEPVRSRAAFLVPVVNKHQRAAAPRVAAVCYVQRDGRCTPN